jgi:predicted PurR-regulated permease PerM
MPFVFLFLLIDDGRIKKSLIDLVPNEYFEVALTLLDNVDRALGAYLRGTALQCSLVGLALAACLVLIGVESQWAVLIGVLAGLANAIPFLGPGIGLIVGVAYALIVEDVHSILPFMDADNLVFGVVASVAAVQVLDNVVLQPFVMGGAVALHPLVVVLGVMGGSILFGVPGMFLAVPTIAVFKVVVTTTFGELRAYGLI